MTTFQKSLCFLSILQLLLAIVALLACANFSTSLDYSVTCADGAVINVSHPIEFPFHLEQTTKVNVTCNHPINHTISKLVYIRGNYKLTAESFVVSSVLFILQVSAALFTHIFSSRCTESRAAQMVHICLELMAGLCWNPASFMWAVGVWAMQLVTAPDYWLFGKAENGTSICSKDLSGQYWNTNVQSCEVLSGGNFAAANVSAAFGVLSLPLWVFKLAYLTGVKERVKTNGTIKEIEAAEGEIMTLRDEPDFANFIENGAASSE